MTNTSSTQTATPPMNDPLLSRAVQQIESKLPDALHDGYNRIVVAGMALMYSNQTHRMTVEYLSNIKSANNDPTMIAHGVLKMISVLFRQSQGKMDVRAAYPAAVTLMCYALQDMEKMFKVTITADTVKQAGAIVAAGILRMFQNSPANTQGAPLPNQAEPATHQAATPSLMNSAQGRT